MALRVVAEDLNDRNGVVTVEGDGQEEVMSPTAKSLAIETASKKISRPGISGNESVYPVGPDGQTSEDLLLGRAGEVTAYRCDYKVSGGL